MPDGASGAERPADPTLDELAAVAATACAAPFALITLVEGPGHRCAAQVGLDAADAPAETALLYHAEAADEILVVSDASADPRFCADPLVVAGPRIRFFGGVPVVSMDGRTLGTLSVMDVAPRELGPAQRRALRTLAGQVASSLDLRRQVGEVEGILAEVARAEEALRRTMSGTQGESDAPLRTVLDNVADGFITYGRGGGIEIYNRAAERLFGYPLSQIVGRNVEMLVPGLVDDMRDGFHGEAEGRRADGSRFPIDLGISEMRQGDHDIFIAIVRDGTAARRMDRRRAAEHGVTRVLAQTITVDDAAPRILEAIGQAAGWTCGAFWRPQREPRRLRCIATWNHPETAPAAFLEATRRAALAPGVSLPGRVWQAGTPEWTSDVGLDERGAAAAAEGLRAGMAFPIAVGGEVLGVVELLGAGGDEPDAEWLHVFAALGGQVGQFIERDEADRALRANDERMRALTENMLEGLITINRHNVIEQVNPAVEQMFGYAAWELVGQHVKILLPQMREVDAFLRDAARRALGRLTEWEGRRRNGEIFRFELSLFAFQTPEGQHFAGHLRDISERRKLEELKQEFVATVSHELRTPLTSIRGSLSLLAGGALGELPDEARDVVAIAERNTVRLMALINDILDLERLEAGRLELHLEATPLASVILRSVESVRAFAAQHGIRLVAPATEATVFGDGDRLVQVLVNLLSNAVKFSPREAEVAISLVDRDGQVEVRVQDRGRGIPSQQHEAVFERFKQVEASDSRHKGGTGLGLAICKAIVEQHGGEIGVESEVGRGSTFWFRVPSKAPAAEKADEFLKALSGQDVLAGDVLLVDGDAALLSVLTRQLLQSGVAVRAVGTAREAVAEVARAVPALLVIDVALPDASGYTVVEALRTRPESSRLPVLIYTALDVSAADQRRLSLGPTRLLTKSRATDAEFEAAVLDLLGAVTSPARRP